MKSCSLPAPRMKPGTSRPPEIMSIIASSSASRSGLPTIGVGLPSNTILTRLVAFASTDASTFITAPIQKGVP